MDYITSFYLCFTCLLGLCVGSFLNVVICRIPEKKSISFPGSHCPSCKKRLMTFDLIPVLSWLALRGRCRFCSENISIRYPIVEFLTSIFFLLSLINVSTINNHYSMTVILISGWVLFSILIALAFIDIEHMILPNKITSIGSLLGIVFTFIFTFSNQKSLFILKENLLIENLTAYLVALICLSLIANIIKVIIRKPALGMGDVKLFAMSGAWLGLSGLEISIVLSFLLAGIFSLIGLTTKLIKRGQYIPFGPFICLSISLVWLLGNQFWYKNLANIFWWRLI